MTSPGPSDAGAAFLRHQEIAFSVCMGMVAVLGRGQPQLASPALLWAFAALLAFNLGYQMVLRRRGASTLVPLASMAVNTVLVSVVLAYSGGTASDFWPMYLLPIFTACLYLQRRHVALALAFATGFLACFYIEALSQGPAWILVELLLKAGVLALAAGVTAQLAVKERRASRALAEARARLEELASTPRPGQKRREPLSKLINGLLYDVNHRLMVVENSAHLLSGADGAPDETRADLARVETAMVSLRRLVADVLELSSPEDAPVNLARLFPQLPALLDFKLQQRQVTLSLHLDDGIPRLAAGRLHLQPALLDLLSEAIEHAKSATTVNLDGLKTPGGACLSLRFTPADGQATLAEAVAGLRARGAEVARSSADGRVELRMTLPDLSASPLV